MKTRIFSSCFSRLPLSYLLLTFLTLFAVSVASAQIPSSGLVGYWPFNGNANDESGNGNNGTVNGPTLATDRFGNANSAYSFGAGNVLIPLTQQMVSMPERTISLWFRSTSNQGGGRLFEATNISWGAACYNSNNIDCWYQKSNQAYNIVQQTFPSNNIWYNLVYTCDSTNQTKKLYLNGVLINSGTPVSNPGNPTAWINHFLKIGQGLANESFAGQIDDIAIYGRSLTSAEIAQIYTSQTSIVQAPCTTLATNLQTGLVGYWPFCGNANDESGNGNNGTVNGATLTTDRFGNANSAYSFDGVNDFIEVPVVQSNVSSYSIVCWFKYPLSPVAGEYKAMVQASGGYPNSQYSLSLQMSINPGGSGQVNNSVTVSINGPGVFNGFISNSAYNDNSWHCVVGVWEAPMGVQTNSAYVKMYLDGNLINNSSTAINYNSVTTPFSGLGNTLFGMMNHLIGGRYYQGDLDDISIYNRALTPAEISQLYTDPSTTPPCRLHPLPRR